MPTYYVIGAGGSDSNGGTNDTSDGWATIQKAADTVIAGDTVWIKATGTYDENVLETTAGSVGSTIWYRGYSSTTGDNGKVTIDPTSAGSCFSCTSYTCFENIIFNGASGSGASTGAGDYCGFYNCEFSNNGSNGATGDNSIGFYNCESYGNGGYGFSVDSSCRWVGCLVYGNTSGFNDNGGTNANIYRCVSYNNGNLGFNGSILNLIGCTFDGDNSTGDLTGSVTANGMVADCIMYDCQGTAIDLPAGNISNPTTFVGYNLINTVGTTYTVSEADAYSRGVLRGYNDVTSAPAFTDETGDDYTLDEASPAIGAGITPGGIT